MSICYTLDIFCDGCGSWVHGTTGRYFPPLISEAREKASYALKGWRKMGKEDLCPECQDLLRSRNEKT
jgi:hypothetical protein